MDKAASRIRLLSLRYKDNTTRDKNETKVGKQSANLGKNNEPIQNRLSFLIDCKSVILHHITILSFPMVRPAWDNWWFLTVVNTFSALFQEKYFLSFVIPPFHLSVATILIVNALCVVELVVELGWNYMKFHP